MFHIIDNIYLSDLKDATNMDLILKNNIKLVVRMSEDDNESIYGSDIVFYNFKCEDNIFSGGNMLKAANEIYKIIIKNKDINILVHCNMGQSRSVSAIIFYMMLKHKYDFFESHIYIKNIKNDININSGFKSILNMVHTIINTQYDFDESIDKTKKNIEFTKLVNSNMFDAVKAFNSLNY